MMFDELHDREGESDKWCRRCGVVGMVSREGVSRGRLRGGVVGVVSEGWV